MKLAVLLLFLVASFSTQASVVDTNFSPVFEWAENETYFDLPAVVQADGKFLVSGRYTKVNGVTASGLVRLNVDGSLDSTFSPVTNAEIYRLIIGADGFIYGNGSAVMEGRTLSGLIKISTNGLIDTNFNVGIGFGYRFAVLLSGNVIVMRYTPHFTEENPLLSLKRPDGTRVEEFAPPVYAFSPHFLGIYHGDIHLLPDGKFYVAGLIFVEPRPSENVHRFFNDGTVDGTFVPAPGGLYDIQDSSLTPDGGILVLNHNYNGLTRLRPDGSPNPSFNSFHSDQADIVNAEIDLYEQIYGVKPSAYRNVLIRLLPNGLRDPSFTQGTGVGRRIDTNIVGNIDNLIVQQNGQAVVLGNFASFDGTPATGMVRLKGGLRISAKGISGRNIKLAATGDTGRRYRIESSSDLESWARVDSGTFTHAPLETSVAVGDGNRFFRVLYE